MLLLKHMDLLHRHSYSVRLVMLPTQNDSQNHAKSTRNKEQAPHVSNVASEVILKEIVRC